MQDAETDSGHTAARTGAAPSSDTPEEDMPAAETAQTTVQGEQASLPPAASSSEPVNPWQHRARRWKAAAKRIGRHNRLQLHRINELHAALSRCKVRIDALQTDRRKLARKVDGLELLLDAEGKLPDVDPLAAQILAEET